MNIKSLFAFFCCLNALFLTSCSKQKSKKKLGDVYYKLALVEIEDSDEKISAYKKALLHLDKALHYDKTQSHYFALYATILIELNNLSGAHDYFQKALVCVGENQALRAEIKNNYACLLAQKGKEEEAFQIWDELIKNNYYVTPEVALCNQAKVYLKHGKYNEAKTKLLAALTCAPSYIDVYYYLAFLECHEFKNFKEAHYYLDRLLFLEPHHAGAHFLASQFKGLLYLRET